MRMIGRSNALAMQVARFAGHYVQMSIAMLAGMLLPVGLLLSALGLSSQVSRSPEASAVVVASGTCWKRGRHSLPQSV
jgi:hypothetical protein